MPYKTEKLKLGDQFLKRNVKLIDCQKAMIHWHHKNGMSITSIGKLFRVNKRMIQFVLFPERHARNLELRKQRGGSKIYYDREKNNKAQREHKAYKHKTLT